MIETAERLVRAIAARDYADIAACFAPDATLRMQSPGPLREEHGPEAIAERFRAWFGNLESFALREWDCVEVQDRVRIHYVAAGSGKATDHTGYLAIEDGLIAWIVMACSGFREERR